MKLKGSLLVSALLTLNGLTSARSLARLSQREPERRAPAAELPRGYDPAWPYSPFTSSGRWILDSRGEHAIFAGGNWPGALLTMVPEGLQYASIDAIAEQIASLGMNIVRLSFATEMIDDIYALGQDTDIKTSFIKVLGQENGTAVLENVLKHNPQFSASTTRLEVFDAVIKVCAKHRIWVHLNNHQSQAGWCCSGDDGNGWFGDTYFNVPNWIRGLEYMAKYAASHSNIVSISLINELRKTPAPGYGWPGWYENMIPAAKAVHAANPELLVFLSGLNYDTEIAPLVSGLDLGDGLQFDLDDFEMSLQRKLVYELHDYSFFQEFTDCPSFDAALDGFGFYVADEKATNVTNRLPLVVTEFGFDPDDYTTLFAQCLKALLARTRVGWTMWDISGSYYIREGIQDFDEYWGLLEKDWTGWRNESTITDYYLPLIDATLNG